MIVIPLKKGQHPNNSAQVKYEIITRSYDDKVNGEPYITAEFSNDLSRTTFPIGDGKYYSRAGVTKAKRKRRDVGEWLVTGTKYFAGPTARAHFVLLESNKKFCLHQITNCETMYLTIRE